MKHPFVYVVESWWYSCDRRVDKVFASERSACLYVIDKIKEQGEWDSYYRKRIRVEASSKRLRASIKHLFPKNIRAKVVLYPGVWQCCKKDRKHRNGYRKLKNQWRSHWKYDRDRLTSLITKMRAE